MEIIEDYATAKRAKKRAPDEDSWTSVDHQELDHATSYVSESMYLVMANPVSTLHVGEVVYFKVHALAGTAHGTLFLTNLRLLFLAFEAPPPSPADVLLEVPLNAIAELAEVRPATPATAMASQLEVACKNFAILRFHFPIDATSGDLYVRIHQTLATKQPQLAYACPPISALPDMVGWAVYNPQREFARLGFRPPPTPDRPAAGFRLAHVNSNYKLSPTYPSAFVVPTAVSDGELRQIAHFRARGRVPAVTYVHRNGAVVARCAQPLVGLRRRRCAADEAFMTALRRESGGRLVFVDCRSQTSAYGNIALGGGFEHGDYYPETTIMFMGIENIHAMRDSIHKLFDLVKHEARGNERTNWLSCLESTRWLEHVRSVLLACDECVSRLTDEATSLVIHCSDGWDRTAQLVALTKLCADPFYRTIRGFQVLVEQEWCAFGHQFRARSGHSIDHASYWEDEHASPVFLQFVDAVWQLVRQFPCSFEFTERYLVALLDEVYGKRSGTFLHDCEESRIGSMTLTRCISAWTLLAAHAQASDFVNPFFVRPLPSRTDARSPLVLRFKWHTSALAIWTSFYLRSLEAGDSRVSQDTWAKELQVTQRELQDQLSTAHEKLQTQVDANSELVTELEALRKESAGLRKALQGQVLAAGSSRLMVHEHEEDDDGVLLSVTPVDSDASRNTWPFSSAPASIRSVREAPPSGLDTHQNGYSLPNGFVDASMNTGFELIHSYFDASGVVNADATVARTAQFASPSRAS